VREEKKVAAPQKKSAPQEFTPAQVQRLMSLRLD
jgi:hypothetical protein